MNCQSRFTQRWTIALLALIPMIAFSGCGPKQIEAPVAYSQWNSKDGSFALKYPEGWDAEGNGSKASGMAYAEFTQGPIQVRIDSSFGDSVKGDIIKMGGGSAAAALIPGDEEPGMLTPEAVIQASWKKHYKKEFPGYREDEGEAIKIPLGKTYVNVFGGKKGFQVVSGIRSTTMSPQRSVTFVAYCPEAQWETFQPVFWKMLESMSLGVEESKF